MFERKLETLGAVETQGNITGAVLDRDRHMMHKPYSVLEVGWPWPSPACRAGIQIFEY